METAGIVGSAGDRGENPAGSAMSASHLLELLGALRFAAEKHRNQRRKGADRPPFINHAIEVAEILARVAGVEDPITLQAAVLHDTLEDTDTLPEELERQFGTEVRRVVEEVSDDKRLPREQRRVEQIRSAPGLSERAKLIRIADKIANVHSVTWSPPVDWSTARRRDYLDWTVRVIDGCRGCSPELERLYDEVLRIGLENVNRGNT
jgi:(p)ppGpp synthase/HD superfamily hydrolase